MEDEEGMATPAQSLSRANPHAQPPYLKGKQPIPFGTGAAGPALPPVGISTSKKQELSGWDLARMVALVLDVLVVFGL